MPHAGAFAGAAVLLATCASALAEGRTRHRRAGGNYTFGATICGKPCSSESMHLVVGSTLYNPTEATSLWVNRPTDYWPVNDVEVLLPGATVTANGTVPGTGCAAYDLNATLGNSSEEAAHSRGPAVVVRRGDCEMGEKVFYAQKAGAKAIIVTRDPARPDNKPEFRCNDVPGLVNCSTLTIPAIYMPEMDGGATALETQLSAGGPYTMDVTCPIATRGRGCVGAICIGEDFGPVGGAVALCPAHLSTTSTTTVTVTTSTTTRVNATTIEATADNSTDSELGLIITCSILAGILFLCIVAAIVIKVGGYSHRIMSRIATTSVGRKAISLEHSLENKLSHMHFPHFHHHAAKVEPGSGHSPSNPEHTGIAEESGRTSSAPANFKRPRSQERPRTQGGSEPHFPPAPPPPHGLPAYVPEQPGDVAAANSVVAPAPAPKVEAAEEGLAGVPAPVTAPAAVAEPASTPATVA